MPNHASIVALALRVSQASAFMLACVLTLAIADRLYGQQIAIGGSARIGMVGYEESPIGGAQVFQVTAAAYSDRQYTEWVLFDPYLRARYTRFGNP